MFAKFCSNNCTTSIFDYHSSYPNFCYDLCLIYCRKLQEGHQPGVDEAESAQHEYQERSNALVRENLCSLERRSDILDQNYFLIDNLMNLVLYNICIDCEGFKE